MKLFEKLRALREQKDITLEEVANALGVTRSAVNQWELDIGNPTTPNLMAIARYYGVSIDSLLNDDVPVGPAVTGIPMDALLRPSEPTQSTDTDETGKAAA